MDPALPVYLDREGKTHMKTLFLVLLLTMITALTACAPQNEVINYRTYTDPEKGIFYIYDGVLDHAELISGVGNEQARVLITREGH